MVRASLWTTRVFFRLFRRCSCCFPFHSNRIASLPSRCRSSRCRLAVAFSVFSGVEPTLASVADLPVVNWLWYLSFSTWTAEGTYVVWARGSVIDGSSASMRERMAVGAAHFGYDISSQTRSVLVLLAIGIAWRAIAAVVLCSLAPMPQSRPVADARVQLGAASSTVSAQSPKILVRQSQSETQQGKSERGAAYDLQMQTLTPFSNKAVTGRTA